MRFWRELVGDRYSGGVIAALLLLTFAFQVMGAGPAAAMQAGALHSDICTAASENPESPRAPEHRRECPCSLLCHAGLQALAVLPPSGTAGIPIRFAEPVAEALPSASLGDPADTAQHRQARAPPLPYPV
jgi:hypothetical protein